MPRIPATAVALPDTAILPPLGARLPGARTTRAHADTRRTVWPWQAALGRWLGRLRERAEMGGLDARERRDAGLTAYDVAFECRKRPWRD